MLVIAMETEPDGHVRWAGRRHDDDRPDASSGASPAELFDAVFHALHDGEQVALGFDCALTMPANDNAGASAGLTELSELLGELGTWRPWTTVSTSLARWKANTSILVWQAVPASGTGAVTATAATESFFRHYPIARTEDNSTEDNSTGDNSTRANSTGANSTGANGTADDQPVVNLAAAAARNAGLFVDPSELTQPATSIRVAAS